MQPSQTRNHENMLYEWVRYHMIASVQAKFSQTILGQITHTKPQQISINR